MSEMVESFKRDLAEVSWRELKIHLKRDAIIIVDVDLNLIDVAVAVANDDKPLVETWIGEKQLGKPTEDHLRNWEKKSDNRFKMLIVQPFILVQNICDA
jgi:hypothetical protein